MILSTPPDKGAAAAAQPFPVRATLHLDTAPLLTDTLPSGGKTGMIPEMCSLTEDYREPMALEWLGRLPGGGDPGLSPNKKLVVQTDGGGRKQHVPGPETRGTQPVLETAGSSVGLSRDGRGPEWVVREEIKGAPP